eukprot:1879303-Pyramimonas_sp.AAC.1
MSFLPGTFGRQLRPAMAMDILEPLPPFLGRAPSSCRAAHAMANPSSTQWTATFLAPFLRHCLRSALMRLRREAAREGVKTELSS